MISQRHLKGIKERGLNVDIAISMGIFSGRRSPVGCAEPDPEGNTLCFPYFERGERLNVKMRWVEQGAKHFAQEPGKPKTFWNADVILKPDSLNELDAGTDELLITEGEFDALAAIQCGHEKSMSVPNGATLPARDKATGELIEVPNDTRDLDPENDRTFSYLTRHMDRLQRVKSFLIATDADEVGQRLAKELVRRIGPARCKWVRYPDEVVVPDRKTGDLRSCKDLNEVLQYLGEDRVRECLESARPFPIKGLFAFSEYPDMGEPVTYPTRLSPDLDDIFRLYPGAFMVATGIPNMGKALALDTPIPTPSGWTTMGDLQVGDTVIDETGAPCRVVATTEVMHDRPCYRMRFGNGQEVVADANHQWLTDSEIARRSRQPNRMVPRGPSIVTTEEISITLHAQGKVNHQVPATLPVQGLYAILPIDPYTLGAWLGDGRTDFGAITAFDETVIEKIAANGHVVRPQAQAGQYGILKLGAKLRDLGVLGNKHIPALYLRASVWQRLQLLQGLMDTDGHCDLNRNCEFVSIRRRLAKDVFELVSSLGIKAGFHEATASLKGVAISDKFRVRFVSELPVFSIPRKLERQKAGTPRRNPNHAIVACERVESVPVRCIQVDSPSHLFLATRSFIPTHNSEIVKQIAVNMGRHYGWHTVMFVGEEPIKPYLHNSLRTKFLHKERRLWSPEDERRAEAFVERHFQIIGNDPRYDEDEVDLDFILDKAATSVFRYGTKLLVIDPWNEIEHKRDQHWSMTEYVGDAIRKLKRFGRSYDVCVIIVAHPKKLDAGRVPGLYDISDSAHWANKPDLALVVHGEDPYGTARELIIPKVRFRAAGRKGTVNMEFDRDLEMYIPVTDFERTNDNHRSDAA